MKSAETKVTDMKRAPFAERKVINETMTAPSEHGSINADEPRLP